MSAPHKLGRSSDAAMLALQMSSKCGQSSEDSMESDVNACRLQLLITQSVLVPMLHLELERPRPPAARGKWSTTAASYSLRTYCLRLWRGSQVFCRQFQFSQAVAIIVRLPTGGTTMALCSSHIRSPGLELSGHLKSMVHGACRWRLPGWGHGPPVCARCHTPGTTQAAPARAAMHDGIITISLSVCTLMWRVSPFATL